MNFQKIFLCLTVLSCSLIEAAPTAPPAKPSVSILKNWTEGGYDIQWEKWSGPDAAGWRLEENGKTVFTANLPASPDGHQTGKFSVRNPLYGTFTYEVILFNQIGQTKSDTAYYSVEGASLIVSDAIDEESQALQINLDPQQPLALIFKVIGTANPRLTVVSNNPSVVQCEMLGNKTVQFLGLKSGRASVCVKDTVSGNTRYLGVRVKDSLGNLPGMPPYISIGSVSEDTTPDLNFWRHFSGDDTNHRADIRYIYINGGPKNQGGGWRTWTDKDGYRVTSFVRESLKLGMIPFLVYYNIPDGGESYYTNKQHLQSASYMEGYFTDLKFALELAKAESADEIIGILLEPDCIGYMAQNGEDPASSFAQTSAAYYSGVLDSNTDPIFPDTFEGTVKAINYIIRKYLPNAYFGWQFNLWASPPGGYTAPIPGNGVIHLTDTLGVEEGRKAILQEAAAIADYYIKAGVLASDADFVSIDKYGLDAGAEGKSETPWTSLWFWNAVHWTNYLEFVKAMNIKSKLPVILWQIPVGRINNSLESNPYLPGETFPPLTNTPTSFEDSAPAYFYGDQFTCNGSRLSFFGTGDPFSKVDVAENVVTWGSHMDLARKAGVQSILFGAGVGISTDGIGDPPTENYWWITKTQRYLKNPMALCEETGDCPQESDLPEEEEDEPGSGGEEITGFPLELSYAQVKELGWGSGAQFSATFTNQGIYPISNFRVKFGSPPSKISLWNVRIITSDGNSVTIGLPAWKDSLAPGEVFTFGFVIQPEKAPSVTYLETSN